MSHNLKLQVVLSAVDKLTAPFRSAQESNKRLASAVRQSRDALKTLNQQASQIDGFRKTKQQLTSTQQAYQSATQRVATLAKEIAKTENPTKKQLEEFKKAQREAGQLKTKYEQLQQSVQRQRSALQANGISTNQLAQAQRRLNGDIERTTQQLRRQENQLRRSAEQERRMAAAKSQYQKTLATRNQLAGNSAGLLGAGTGLGVSLVKPVSAFTDSENAAMKLKVSMMGANGEVLPEFEKVNELAVRLGDRLPGTTADFQNMMTMLRRQGMSASAILNGLGEATAYLGVQLEMAPDQAAEFAAKLQDATQTSEKDMMSLMDVIQKGYYAGVDPRNMLQGYSKISSAMSILKIKGLEASKTFAPFLVMADQAGMAGESAGNAYRKIFQAVMKTENIEDLNEELALKGIKGVHFDFTDGKGEFGGIEKMYSQLGQLKKLNTSDRLSVIKNIFGDDAETLQVLNILIEKGVIGYQEAQQKLAAQAELRTRVDTTLDTLGNKWEAATGSMTNAMSALGETVAPTLKRIADYIGELANKSGEWIKQNPELAGGLFKVVGVLALVMTVLGGLGLMLAAVLGPLAAVKLSLSVLGIKGGGALTLLLKPIKLLGSAFLWLGKAMLANPILLAIAAIAGAIYLIYKNWDKIEPYVTKVWESVKQRTAIAWQVLKETINRAWEGIKSFFFNWTPLGLIIKHWDSIVSYTNNAWTTIKNKISACWEGIKTTLKNRWDEIIKSVQETWESIKTTISTKWDEIVDDTKKLPTKFLQLGSDLIDSIIQGIKNKWKNFKQSISELATTAKEALTPEFVKNADPNVQSALDSYNSNFAGMYDSGGYIPRGQFGIAGENGPEIVEGPANITSRKQTAMLATAALSLGSAFSLQAQNAPLHPHSLPIENYRTAPANVNIQQQRYQGAPAHYEINIHPQPNQSAQDIAQLVIEEIERRERDKQARLNSRYQDSEVW